MKIDLHTHTRKCKSGDAPTREITPEDFRAAVEMTNVGIMAITNHNLFDLDQFERIVDIMQDGTQIWPGIELDVVEDQIRGLYASFCQSLCVADREILHAPIAVVNQLLVLLLIPLPKGLLQGIERQIASERV